MDPGGLNRWRHIIKKTRQGHRKWWHLRGWEGQWWYLPSSEKSRPGNRGCGKGPSAGEEDWVCWEVIKELKENIKRQVSWCPRNSLSSKVLLGLLVPPPSSISLPSLWALHPVPICAPTGSPTHSLPIQERDRQHGALCWRQAWGWMGRCSRAGLAVQFSIPFHDFMFLHLLPTAPVLFTCLYCLLTTRLETPWGRDFVFVITVSLVPGTVPST